MPRLSKPLPENVLTVGDAVAMWERSLRASDRITSQRTIDAYMYATGKLISYVGDSVLIKNVDVGAIESLLLSLKEAGMSPAARLAVYRPLQTFFKWAVGRGHVAANPMDGIDKPRVVVQPVEFVTDAELAAILATTVERSRHAFRARRDRAIILLLATTGARLSEIALLQVTDCDLGQGVLTVLGKGGKVRILPLLDDALEALKLYLTRERPRSPHSGSSSLWLGPRGGMTASGIAQMLAERGQAAGITRRVHPHELRHRFIARSLRAGMSGPLVMALSGHTTPAMLNRYGAFTRAQDAMNALRELAAAGAV